MKRCGNGITMCENCRNLWPLVGEAAAGRGNQPCACASFCNQIEVGKCRLRRFQPNMLRKSLPEASRARSSALLAAQSRWIKRHSPRPSSTRQAPIAAACSTSDSAAGSDWVESLGTKLSHSHESLGKTSRQAPVGAACSTPDSAVGTVGR